MSKQKLILERNEREKMSPNMNQMGSGCGSVGRAVAFDTRDPRFDSSHQQTFIKHLFNVNCVEKTKIKKKEAGNGPFFFKKKHEPNF